MTVTGGSKQSHQDKSYIWYGRNYKKVYTQLTYLTVNNDVPNDAFCLKKEKKVIFLNLNILCPLKNSHSLKMTDFLDYKMSLSLPGRRKSSLCFPCNLCQSASVVSLIVDCERSLLHQPQKCQYCIL